MSPGEEGRLQRLFSAFPGGAPGAGLLLLRVAIGVTGVAGSGIAVAGEPAVSGWYGAATILFSTLVLIGLLTPVAGAGLAACRIALAAAGNSAPIPDTGGQALLLAVVIAIALIGPGEFSVDAYLFGRRRVVIPPAR